MRHQGSCLKLNAGMQCSFAASFLENKYFTLLAKQGLTRNSGNLEQGPAYGVPGGLKT